MQRTGKVVSVVLGGSVRGMEHLSAWQSTVLCWHLSRNFPGVQKIYSTFQRATEWRGARHLGETRPRWGSWPDISLGICIYPLYVYSEGSRLSEGPSCWQQSSWHFTPRCRRWVSCLWSCDERTPESAWTGSVSSEVEPLVCFLHQTGCVNGP